MFQLLLQLFLRLSTGVVSGVLVSIRRWFQASAGIPIVPVPVKVPLGLVRLVVVRLCLIQTLRQNVSIQHGWTSQVCSVSLEKLIKTM